MEENTEEDTSVGIDIDGDGKTSPWEANLCRLCLLIALASLGHEQLLMALV